MISPIGLNAEILAVGYAEDSTGVLKHGPFFIRVDGTGAILWEAYPTSDLDFNVELIVQDTHSSFTKVNFNE